MKKVLALVLAVMMMATVAFAATGAPGSTTDVDKDSGKYVPGKSLKVYTLTPEGDEKVGAINTKNYTLGKITYTQGKSLVESVKINDTDECLVIKLKQDYTITEAKKLQLEIELKGKKVDRDTKYADAKITVDNGAGAPAEVNYALDVTSLEIDKDYEIADMDVAADDTVYKVTKASDGKAYGTLNLTAKDTDVDVEVRVYEKEKYFLASDVDANTETLKKYADTDATLDFLTFKAAPTFNSTATVRFYKPDDTFVYEMKDGKVVKEIKYNEEDGCFLLKTRTLGSYVFSDKKLNISEEAPADQNPDTGANDVVGIATAIAAVALVSAAAVSLKK